jgi:hypothetical protein
MIVNGVRIDKLRNIFWSFSYMVGINYLTVLCPFTEIIRSSLCTYSIIHVCQCFNLSFSREMK